MEGLSEVLLKGGPIALIVATALAIKFTIQGVAAWRASRHDDPNPSPTQPTDAATTNAMLLDSLRLERSEAARKEERIDELEAEVDSLRSQLSEQQRAYEREIGALRSKVQEVTLQLEALQQRIHAGLSNLPPSPEH